MSRLGSPNLNPTFNPGALPDTQGGAVFAIEILAADPTLVSGQTRVWFNTTDKKIKVSIAGATALATDALV